MSGVKTSSPSPGCRLAVSMTSQLTEICHMKLLPPQLTSSPAPLPVRRVFTSMLAYRAGTGATVGALSGSMALASATWSAGPARMRLVGEHLLIVSLAQALKVTGLVYYFPFSYNFCCCSSWSSKVCRAGSKDNGVSLCSMDTSRIFQWCHNRIQNTSSPELFLPP